MLTIVIIEPPGRFLSSSLAFLNEGTSLPAPAPREPQYDIHAHAHHLKRPRIDEEKLPRPATRTRTPDTYTRTHTHTHANTKTRKHFTNTTLCTTSETPARGTRGQLRPANASQNHETRAQWAQKRHCLGTEERPSPPARGATLHQIQRSPLIKRHPPRIPSS
jgi:hypothetical protein